jgi:hypothetical protein
MVVLLHITRQLPNEEFIVVKLKLYGHHHYFVNWYEYMCHKRPRISSLCWNHNHMLSTVMTYHPILDKCDTADATNCTGTA